MKYSKSLRQLPAVCALTLVIQSPSYADFHYTVSLLPSNDEPTEVYDISNTGIVVGASQKTGGVAVYWENGIYTEFTGIPSESEGADAQGVNDFGVIVGSTNQLVTDGSEEIGGYVWESGVITDLEPVPNNISNFAVAMDINNNGEIVGKAADFLGAPFATVWRNGVASTIGSEVTNGNPDKNNLQNATAINEAGDIAGFTEYQSPQFGWLFSQGELTTIFDTLGIGLEVLVNDINDSKQIVGSTASIIFTNIPFVWENSVMTELPTLSKRGVAFGINNSSRIVGKDGSPDTSRAALWENGTVFDLNTLITPDSGWHISEARAINDSNIIVGVGTAPGSTASNEDVFLLTPITAHLSQAIPGIAGQLNTFEISSTTPGERITLMMSGRNGYSGLPGCNGAALSLDRPRSIGTAVADDLGNASIDFTIPERFAGRALKIQATQINTCEITDVITQTF